MSATPSAAVGDATVAKDRVGAWLPAEVVSERGEGQTRELLLKFKDWGPGHNEWIGVSSGRLVNFGDEAAARRRDALASGFDLTGFHDDDESWEALCVVGKWGSKHSLRYKVCWAAPYTAADYSWEPASNVSDDLIAAFNAAPPVTKKKPKKKPKKPRASKPRVPRPPPRPRVPYTVEQLGDDDDAAVRRRVAPVTERLRVLRRVIAKHSVRNRVS